MTQKPSWLTKPKILAFGLALVAAGYFTPIYQIAEQTFGKEEAKQLLVWLLNAKDELEQGEQPKPDVPPVPPVTGYQWDAKKLTIAGMDRDWYKHDPAKIAKLVRESGCNAVSVEMVADDTFAKGNPEAARKPYLALLQATRDQKLILFVSVVNDWIQDGWWKNMPTLLAIVLDGGAEGVIVQPVAETHTAKGAVFEKDAIAKLKAKGFKTCYNGSGGRPSGKNGCDYFAWHTAGTPSTAPNGSIEITDHSASIRDIGYFDAGKAEKYAKSAKSRGAGFGLYRYVGMGGRNGSPSSLPVEASFASWKAMVKVYGEASGTTGHPPVTNGKDELDISGGVVWVSPNALDIQRIPSTHILKSAKLEANKTHVRLDYSVPSSYWRPNPSKAGDLARLHVYWKEGNQIYASHTDWVNVNQTYKTLNNLPPNGIYVKRRPPAGTILYFSVVSNDGKGRTNFKAADVGWK